MTGASYHCCNFGDTNPRATFIAFNSNRTSVTEVVVTLVAGTNCNALARRAVVRRQGLCVKRAGHRSDNVALVGGQTRGLRHFQGAFRHIPTIRCVRMNRFDDGLSRRTSYPPRSSRPQGVAVALALALAVALLGCGGSGDDLVISSARSFAGVVNGGTLKSTLQRFGTPSQLYDPDQSGNVDCIAVWKRYGVEEHCLQDFAAQPPSRARRRRVFRLSEVTLRGSWSTDRGLRIGDTVAKMFSLYRTTITRGCVTDRVPNGTSWSLERTADPLGGPGAHICTLGALADPGPDRGIHDEQPRRL